MNVKNVLVTDNRTGNTYLYEETKTVDELTGKTKRKRRMLGRYDTENEVLIPTDGRNKNKKDSYQKTIELIASRLYTQIEPMNNSYTNVSTWEGISYMLSSFIDKCKTVEKEYADYAELSPLSIREPDEYEMNFYYNTCDKMLILFKDVVQYIDKKVESEAKESDESDD